jgi:hypothetical protein
MLTEAYEHLFIHSYCLNYHCLIILCSYTFTGYVFHEELYELMRKRCFRKISQLLMSLTDQRITRRQSS